MKTIMLVFVTLQIAHLELIVEHFFLEDHACLQTVCKMFMLIKSLYISRKCKRVLFF